MRCLTERERANLWRATRFLVWFRKTVDQKMGTGELVAWRRKAWLEQSDLHIDELDELAKELRP